MNLDLAIVLAQLLLVLRRQVLVAEEDDAALGDQESQLVALLVRQVLQLQALNLRPNVCRQIRHLGGRPQQVLLGLVGTGAGIHIGVVLVADLVAVVEVQRPCWPVWVTIRQVDAGLGQPFQGRLGQAEAVLPRLCNVHNGRVDGRRCHLVEGRGTAEAQGDMGKALG